MSLTRRLLAVLLVALALLPKDLEAAAGACRHGGPDTAMHQGSAQAPPGAMRAGDMPEHCGDGPGHAQRGECATMPTCLVTPALPADPAANRARPGSTPAAPTAPRFGPTRAILPQIPPPRTLSR